MSSGAIATSMLAQTVRMAVPYACAAVGGVWCERSGIVNIALEGILLAGGLGGVVAHVATGSAVVGVLAGAATGALFGLVHALMTAAWRVDAIVSGIALNVIAAGGTRFVLRALYDSSSNSPSVTGFHVGGPLLVRTLFDPMTLLAILITVGSSWLLFRTRFGLRMRACGEDPVAAASVGVAVVRTRIVAVTVGGALCALGGVALAFDQHQFQSGMSGGRGYIALAAVIVAGWRPARAVAACLVFASLDALEIVLQTETRALKDVMTMLPYVATLVALVALSRRGASTEGRAPSGLGKHPT
jgi:simple sugar transport system permease protein